MDSLQLHLKIWILICESSEANELSMWMIRKHGKKLLEAFWKLWWIKAQLIEGRLHKKVINDKYKYFEQLPALKTSKALLFDDTMVDNKRLRK